MASCQLLALAMSESFTLDHGQPGPWAPWTMGTLGHGHQPQADELVLFTFGACLFVAA